MNLFSISSTLLLIGIFTAHTASAQCPEGKSEIVIVTPNGVAKNICVQDDAISGLEQAQHNSPIDLSQVCPCIPVWTGRYTQDTQVVGTPPVLPESLSGYSCGLFRGGPPAQSIVLAIEPDGPAFAAGARGVNGDFDRCIAASSSTSPESTATYERPGGELFPEEIFTDAIINDPRLAACRDFLVDRGCDYITDPTTASAHP